MVAVALAAGSGLAIGAWAVKERSATDIPLTTYVLALLAAILAAVLLVAAYYSLGRSLHKAWAVLGGVWLISLVPLYLAAFFTVLTLSANLRCAPAELGAGCGI